MLYWSTEGYIALLLIFGERGQLLVARRQHYTRLQDLISRAKRLRAQVPTTGTGQAPNINNSLHADRHHFPSSLWV